MLDTAPLINSSKLMMAIQRAERNLREFLKDTSIRFVLIQDKDSPKPIKQDYNKEWQNVDGFNWNIYLDELESKPEQFIVAIYRDDALLGLSSYDIRGTGTKNKRLCIHSGEKNRNYEHLRWVFSCDLLSNRIR